MDSGPSSAIRRNIWKLNVLSALSGAIFLIPIIIPFYLQNGVTLTQVFLLEAIFSAEVVLLEIPTGYLADRWGRKHTLITAFVFATFGWILYATGTGFSFFLAGEILMGIGSSLLSGTLEALTYDTLLECGKTPEYRRTSGHQNFLMFSTEAVCSIIGGMIAVVSIRGAAWATVASPLIGLLVSLTLVEPHRHKLQGTQHFGAILAICKRTLIHHVPLRSIIILHGLLSTMTLSLFWLTQPYQTLVLLPIGLFGVTHAVIVATGALSARYAHAVSKYIDDRLFLLFIAIIVVVSYLYLGFIVSLWSLSFFFLTRLAWGFLSPLTSDMANRMTTSDVRATVLSIRALSSRLLFALASPFIGYAADVLSLNQALLLTGGIGGICLAVLFFLMQPVWEKLPR